MKKTIQNNPKETFLTAEAWLWPSVDSLECRAAWDGYRAEPRQQRLARLALLALQGVTSELFQVEWGGAVGLVFLGFAKEAE